MRARMRFPGQRHVAMRAHPPPFMGGDEAVNIRMRLGACGMCRIPIAIEIEYVIGKFGTVMLMLAKCPALWRIITEHPFDFRRLPGQTRAQRVCHACRDCRPAFSAYIGRPLPAGGAVRTLYNEFAVRYASSTALMLRVRDEIQKFVDDVRDDADDDMLSV